ncbi:MAG: lipid-A-disaccharide synthase [Draconibacterium sp.]|nr:lipid-A-disaccharide synthase [Draconibacterium sp.]
MKYYLIAGEASGDLHGSNLLKELAVADTDAQFRYFGGDLMQSVGGDLVKHYREMAFMGFLDVLLNIRTIKRNMEFCKKDLLQFKPDVLILIDYPGFNLRIAEFAKSNNIKVFYYISPKLWAWKEFRVKKIKAFVDEMFTIFPFETEFYARHNFKVNYVGNPLMDSISNYKKTITTKAEFFEKNSLDNRSVVVIMAGSRIKEIKRVLPTMVKVTEGLSNFQFVIAGVKNIEKNVYDEIIGDKDISIIFDQTYDLLSHAHTALVTSGTAALETALFNVPQVVLYKMEGGLFIDMIMRNFVLKTNWVSLPNIILQKGAILELIQKDLTVKKVSSELNKLLFDNNYREIMLKHYSRLNKLMGEPGCSKRAAEKMVNSFSRNPKPGTRNPKL